MHALINADYLDFSWLRQLIDTVSRTLSWIEKDDGQSTLVTGTVEGDPKMNIGRPGDINGDEASVVYDKPNRKVYIVRNGQLLQYNTETFESKVLVPEGVSSVALDPNGNVVYPSPSGNKYKVSIKLCVAVRRGSQLLN